MARIGSRTHYFPSLSGHIEQMRRQIAIVRDAGLKGVLIAPMIAGVSTFHQLLRDNPDLAFMGHPAMSGSGQIVQTINLGAMDAGRHTFTWDASQYPGVKSPTFEITATIGGKTVDASPLVRDKVVSVSTDNGTMNVQLKNLGSVPYSSVSSIL